MDPVAIGFDSAFVMDVSKGLCAPLNIPEGMTPNDWYAGHGDKAERARRELAIKVCRKCPLFAECRIKARQHRELDGIWGGETPEQRHEYLYPLKASEAPVFVVERCDVHDRDMDTLVHSARGAVVQYCKLCRIEWGKRGKPADPICQKHNLAKVSCTDNRKVTGQMLRCRECMKESSDRTRARRQAAGLTSAGKPRRRENAA